MKYLLCLLVVSVLFVNQSHADKTIPKSYANIKYNDQGQLIAIDPNPEVDIENEQGLSGDESTWKLRHKTIFQELLCTLRYATWPLADEMAGYTLDMVRGDIKGTNKGFKFTFKDSKGEPAFAGGTLFYALADLQEKYPKPKWKRSANIDRDGQAHAKLIGKLQGKYDFIDWEGKKQGIIFYRLADEQGHIIYQGKFYFTGTGPFRVDPHSIIEGPFVNLITADSAVVSFETLSDSQPKVEIQGETVSTEKLDGSDATHHELKINGLKPNTTYQYTVSAGGAHQESYSFTTQPLPGSRQPFTFAYTSDSRNGIVSGERDVTGVNAYMMKRIAALMNFKNAKFLQFTGDEINGYNNSPLRQAVEYVNWKNATLPFASYIPIYASQGNHEALLYSFDDGSERGAGIDRFPYATESAEALFAQAFVNPTNGPDSEDGSAYDPSPSTIDFPSYQENVFYYTYDNVAVVSLNSNYWYAPSFSSIPILGGNLHGYLMDNQMQWLKQTLDKLEANENIDHIFVTQHTPVFPNGGHVKDDMFYNGDNQYRPYIADAEGKAKPVKQGIIERRDEYWKMLMDSPKVFAVLTGDEHNYSRLEIKPGMPIYSDQYRPEKPLPITRTIYQIHSGAAGAPYYGKEDTPWSGDVKKGTHETGEYLKNFTTENAVIFFHVNGKSIFLEVINPDTLDTIDTASYMH